MGEGCNLAEGTRGRKLPLGHVVHILLLLIIIIFQIFHLLRINRFPICFTDGSDFVPGNGCILDVLT